MKKIFLGIVVFVLSLFVFAGVAKACDKRECGWDVKGTFQIDYTLTGGGIYSHSYTIDTFNKFTGDFSGTGTYVPDASYTEIITGNLKGSDIKFHILYTGGNPGYTADATGTIADDGTMLGTATGSPGQVFTWVATSKLVRFEDCWKWDGHWMWDKFKGWHEDGDNGNHFGDKHEEHHNNFMPPFHFGRNR